MKQNLIEIACIIDRSGSMDSIATDAIGGFNSFLAEQQRDTKEHDEKARLTVVLFDHEYEIVCDGVNIENAKPLDNKTYVPRGTTALYDAIGRTLDDLGAKLTKRSDDERPTKIIIAILTDGLENASKDYSQAKVAEMIEHQRSKYSWEFVFLAANQDAIEAAAQISIQAQDAMPFTASPQGTHIAMARMSAEVSKRKGRT